MWSKPIWGAALCAALVSFSFSVRAQVVLNEVVASNALSVVDVYGASPDWIELHNPTAAAIDLTGWMLEDTGAEWVFPAVTLGAGAYLLVMASDRDEVAAGGELHTNFKLKADGEYLALKDNIGALQDEYAPAYPALGSDEAYGVDSLGQRNVLLAPTPGAANTGPAPQPVTPSQSPRVFNGTLDVALSTTPAFPIHYTTDGTRPTAASPQYTAPLTLTSTTTVRAVTVAAGALSSVSAFTYTNVDAALLGDNSDLPLILITTENGAVNATEQPAHILAIDTQKSTGRAQLVDAARHDGLATIKTRGSSSSSFPKKQFKLELRREWTGDESREVNFLDLGKESHFVINGPGYFDRAYIQNALMQEWGARMGSHKLNWRFVEVYLDDDGNGQVDADDYYGLMLVLESIKIDESRLDLADLEPTDIVDPEVTGGYVVRVDRAAPRSVKVLDAPGGGDVQLYRPFSDEVAPEQLAYITQYVTDVDASLANGFYDANGTAALIDVQTWLDPWIVDVIANDPDMHRLSTYLYKDREGVLQSGPIWDCDRCINSTDGRNNPPNSLFSSGATDPFGYFWWGELWTHAELRARWYARYKEARATVMSDAMLMADIDRLAAIIDEAYVREIARWGTTAGYGSRYGGTLAGEIAAMKTWLNTRTAYLDGLFMTAGTPPVLTDPTDLEVFPGDSVSVQLAATDTGPVAYGVVGLPDGLTLDRRTGLITGMLAPGAPKHNDIVVFATNGDGASHEQTFTLTYQNTTGYWGDAATEDIVWRPNSGVFKYNNTGADLGTAWRASAYNDSAWPEGPGGLGNAGSAGAVINTCFVAPPGASIYFRKHFAIGDVDGVVGMLAQFRYDDAVVVWLNGTEVYRTPRGNIPASGEVPFDQAATSGGPGNFYALVPGNYDYPSVGAVSVPPIPATLLVEGDNVIAVQLFNRAASDDTNFDSALSIFRLENVLPALTNPGDQVHVEGATVSVAVSGSDPDLGDTITFSATGTPPGVSVVPATGAMVGVLFTPGVYNATLSVSDQRGGTTSVDFVWTVQLDTDGDGDPDVSDPDDDNDMTLDEDDAFPLDPAEDTDSDGDGVGDNSDVCVNDADNDVDGDTLCADVDNCPGVSNVTQTDEDGDLVGNACDICPKDADDDIDSDGVCGDLDNCPVLSNAEQADSDDDGPGDVCDICPLDDADDADADGVCGDVDNCPALNNGDQANADADALGDVCDSCVNDADNDIDSDGLCGDVDNCPAVGNPMQLDADGDLLGNDCDPDDDNDLVDDVDDNCVFVANPDQNDEDSDGVGDACSDDVDGDGVNNDVDNCVMVANAEQTDDDSDGQGDACDVCPLDAHDDADGDGLCADVDNCPAVDNPGQTDEDSDMVGDVCDPCPSDVGNDPDDDGVCALSDNCPGTANAAQTDGDADGAGDACDVCPEDDPNDTDGDGVCQSTDNCPDDLNEDQSDVDNDARGDVCDVCPLDAADDADGDGLCADVDNCPEVNNPMQTDSDGDGVGDACELVGDGDGGPQADAGSPGSSDGGPMGDGDGGGCTCTSASGGETGMLAFGALVFAVGRRRRSTFATAR